MSPVEGDQVGAGSVVAKDVPPYAVVAGNRAAVVKYRFPEDWIPELLKLDFSRWSKELCARYVDLLARPCDLESLRTLIAAASGTKPE